MRNIFLIVSLVSYVSATKTCTIITDDISSLEVEPWDFLSRHKLPAGVDLPAGTESWLLALSGSNQPRYTATVPFDLDYFSDLTVEFAVQVSNGAAFVVASQLDDALYERSISEQKLAKCESGFRNLTLGYPGVSTGQHELTLVFQSKSFANEWLVVPSVSVTACYEEPLPSAVYWAPIVGAVVLFAAVAGCILLRRRESQFVR